ncbi:MAG TPA: fatty acid oxidation complex subunit alpha FadJ [Polyangiaceae bacterium LLY-WYZ-14_1]|nr:fatty acid oxidation complex subunit alpha FadJ [Polyangiaceae bacterium LLY-WYZ-14_1]
MADSNGENARPAAGEDALRIDVRDDGVAVVTMDVPGESTNTLRADFTDQFARAFGELESDSAVRAVVFTSGKKDSFLAGADVSMLDGIETAEQGATLSRGGQDAMSRIADFPKPVVAAIHGAALGGGLELALACHERVASDSPKTKLGVPEVQLGLLPGAGGTQRLPRLIGVQPALDLMLTGKQVDPKKARKMGLVDEVVPPAIILEVAAKRALALADEGFPKKPEPFFERLRHLLDPEELQEVALAKNPAGRRVLFDQARKQTLAKTKGNYPAPEKILDVVRVGLEKGLAKGLEAEARAFGELLVTPEAKELMNIFFATQALKKDNGVDDANVTARPIGQVAMLGAGLMGAGIAYVTSQLGGIPVRLKDKDDGGLLRGLGHIRKELSNRVKRRKMSPREAERVMTYVTGTTRYDGFSDIPLVIEAVFEDLELKHQMIRDVESVGPKDVIFASNTSSIPIGRIAEASAHPETVIGMHYFSPVEKMPLLEIIVTDQTADWVTATCVALGKKQGKTVIVVHDGVGFYTSRILGPYMNETAFIFGEGVSVENIDRALTQWGFPVGPIKLLDEVGIDVAAKVGGIVHAAFGDRMAPPAGFEKLLADDRKGRKNGRGFYRYGDGDKAKEVDETVYQVLGVEPTTEMPQDEIAERCALQMVNEAALCFGEGILRSARDGDIGAIFGLGFPPFRGGPFRWVDAVGPQAVLRKMERYQDRYGARFTPAPVLVEMAKEGRSFHGDKRIEPGHQPETGAAVAAAPAE